MFLGIHPSYLVGQAIYVGACLLAFLLSTLVVRRGIPKLKGAEKLPDSSAGGPIFDFGAAGFWIGFCETILIFFLVLEGEYGALAIIIGAKEFVRKEKIEQNASYYLLGTLVNLTIAVAFARLAMVLSSLAGDL